MTDRALEIAVDLIAREEGFRSEPYLDVADPPVATIGYGFTYHEDGTKVTMQDPPMDEEAARMRLQALVAKVLHNVRGMAPAGLTANQEAALTSFAYNLGTGALRSSTLMKLLNEGDVTGAADQFGRWVYAGGKVWPGLVSRRARERELFLAPDEAATA